MEVKGSQIVGTILEHRYRVESLLARGGMSAVYLAMDTRLERYVAIKVMDPRFAGDSSFLRRFELEARSAARLHHPHVVAVHDQGVDVGQNGEFPYLVMELVGGGTLRDLLDEQGALHVAVVFSVLDPMLSALAAAHRADLVHRDVKPENVLIGTDGAIKVADFGLVRAIASANSTTGSTILGTLAYLSPEQVATGRADARSDVYSAGIVAFEMLTGRVPYTGDTALSVAYQHVNGDVPAPRSLRADLPPAVDELILRATRRDAAARPADANAFRRELHAVRTALGLDQVGVPVPTRERTVPVTAAQLADSATVPRNPPRQRAPGSPRGTRALSRPELDVSGPVEARRSPGGPPTGPPPKQDYYSPEQHRSSLRRGRRKLTVWLAVLVLLGVIVGVGAWWLGSGRYTTVPDTVGMTQQRAVQALDDASLQPKVSKQNNDRVTAGNVIGTDPRGGADALRDAQVTVVVSTGKPIVPDVGPGTAVADAKQAIADAGLRVTDEASSVYDDHVRKGTVVRLDPAPGTQVRSDAAITLVLSKGPSPKPVPDVNGMSRGDAFARLRATGLQPYEADRVFSPQVGNGHVVSTEPAAGTKVDISANPKVGVVLSNAVTVPSLRGKSVSAATAALKSANLRTDVRHFFTRANGRVINQSPSSGSQVAPGSTVVLFAFP
ncbi:MAG: PASTA domain-containing protein [Sciscionella sp.]